MENVTDEDTGTHRRPYRSYTTGGSKNQMCATTKSRSKKRFMKRYEAEGLDTTSQSIGAESELQEPVMDKCSKSIGAEYECLQSKPSTSTVVSFEDCFLDSAEDEYLPSLPSLVPDEEEFAHGIHWHSSAKDNEELLDTDWDYTSEDEEPDPSTPETEHCQDHVLYPGANITLQQSTLLILAFMIRFGLPENALDFLLQVISSHLPSGSILPRSAYFFRKLIRSEDNFTIYFPCNQCENSVTKTSPTCSCGNEVDTKSMKKSGNFFIIFDIKKQISSLLSMKRIASHICETFKLRKVSNGLGEIWSGEMYKKLNLGKFDLSCSVNTDGVTAFKSSNLSLWPILYTINELPYQMRRKYVLVAGLYFGKAKPNFNTFFKPIVSMFKDLYENGITWNYLNCSYISRVKLLCVISDSMARFSVQGLSQHNSVYGCNCCLAKSTAVENRPGKRVYLPTFPLPKRRTNANYLACLDQKTYGVQKRSCLLDLPYFDVIVGFPTDYMHNLCLGVGKTLTLNMLDSKNHSKKYYLGRMVEDIDQILLEVKVPYEIPRIVRPLSQVAHWKGSEWRTWIFIAPVVLHDFLPKEYLEHFGKLSSAMYNLLGEHISILQLQNTEKLLIEFVCDMYLLYDENFCTYNVHLASHLCDFVRWYGGLYNTSCFMFESFNGKLMRLFNGTRFVPDQISKRVCDIHYLRTQHEIVFKNSTYEQLHLNLINNEKTCQFVSHSADIVLLGRRRKSVDMMHFFKNTISQWCGEVPVEIVEFRHFIKHGIKFTANTKSSKRENSIVTLNCGNHFKLLHILCVRTLSLDNMCIGIGVECTLNNLDDFPDNVHIIEMSQRTTVIHLTSVTCQKIISCCDNKYCVRVPNVLELD